MKESLYGNTRTWDTFFKGHTSYCYLNLFKKTPFQHFPEGSVIAKREVTSNCPRAGG